MGGRIERFVLAVGTTLIIGLSPGTAAAALDANCPGPPNDQFLGAARAAQTFTPLASGSLTKAQVAIVKTGSGDFQMQIMGIDSLGAPNNTLLGSTTIPDASVPTGASTLVGSFATPAAVQAGHAYALVVSESGGPFTITDRHGDPCPGQEFYSGPNLTDPWSPASSGAPYDFVYSVFVDPPDFGIGKVKGKTLSLTVPLPGVVTVQDGSQVHATSAAVAAKKKALLKTSKKSVPAAGTVKVKLKLTKPASQQLASNGKLKVKAGITFTPTGGPGKTKIQKLKLKK